MSTIRSWAKWAGDPTFLSDYRSPTPGRKPGKVFPGGFKDIRAIMAAADCHRDRSLVALCGYAGLRVSEAVQVTASDLVDYHGSLSVHVRHGKGDKERWVPLQEDAIVALFLRVGEIDPRLLDVTPLAHVKERGAAKILDRLSRRAGKGSAATHMYRRTFLTAVYNKTKDIRVTQHLAGHASPDTTVGYINVSVESLVDAVKL